MDCKTEKNPPVCPPYMQLWASEARLPAHAAGSLARKTTSRRGKMQLTSGNAGDGEADPVQDQRGDGHEEDVAQQL